MLTGIICSVFYICLRCNAMKLFVVLAVYLRLVQQSMLLVLHEFILRAKFLNKIAVRYFYFSLVRGVKEVAVLIVVDVEVQEVVEGDDKGLEEVDEDEEVETGE